MARIHIDSITCINQQEAGSDEIYFRFVDEGGSGKLVSNTMKSLDEETGDAHHTVHPSETFSFSDKVRLEIWEDDIAGQYGYGPSLNDELVFRKQYDAPSSHGMYQNEYSYFSEHYNSEYKVKVTVWGDDFFG